MSLEAMTTMMAKRWEEGSLLNTAESWRDSITGADDFTKIAPRSGWALVSKDVLPDSTSKNYIEQTEVIIKALKDAAFEDIELPEEYAKAIIEWEEYYNTNFRGKTKVEIDQLLNREGIKYAKQLSELKINQLTRQSVQETIYDLAMYHDTYNNRRLLPNKYTWSNSCSSDGYLVRLGFFAATGVIGYGLWFRARNRDVGVSLSRRVA
ncbi:MAG: hypothetical protein Q8Q18_03875 [bacterium]|nr:hypothetical protein [bacterium]